MKYFLPIVALLTAFAELQGTDEFIAANTGTDSYTHLTLPTRDLV